MFGDNHMSPLGGVFKSSLHALFTKSKMADFLLGGANDVGTKVVQVDEY